MAGFYALISLGAHFIEHFTGGFVEETLERHLEDSLDSVHVEDSYVSGESLPFFTGRLAMLESDFTRHDPTDCVYEEYKCPSHSNDRFGWKLSRPSVGATVVKSVATVSCISMAAGMSMGLLSALLINISLNTVCLCHWEDDRTLPRLVRDIRFVSYVFASPFIYCYYPILLILVFKWSLVKEQNLLVINLIALLLNIFYRLVLRMFNAYTYKSFVLPYPVNIIRLIVILLNGYLVSRTIHPHSVRKAIKLCLKLSVQYLVGLPLIYVILYVVCRYYTKLPHGYLRIVLVGVTGFVVLVFKALIRLCISGIEITVHPGNYYILLSGLYGTCAVILRVLQAEQDEFYLYCLIGVVHGIAFVVERAAVPITDFVLRKVFNSAARIKYKTPRSQRLIADVSIQTMMFESSGLIICLSTTLFYKLLYAKLSAEAKRELVFEIVKRMGSGLAIEWFFDAVAVFIQTRFMNIAIISVWKLKWRRHMLVGVIISLMTVSCFTMYLLRVVRSQEKHSEIFIDNCTVLPFSTYY